MGEIAAENADIVIVTDDNPRSENPATIRAAILAAAKGAIEIGDRAEAIRTRGCRMLQPGDALLIVRQGPRDRPDRRRPHAAFQRSRGRPQRRLRERACMSEFLWTSAAMVDGDARHGWGALPEGITGISIDTRTWSRATPSSRSRASA
jgi:hypothetical protein